MRHFLFEEQEYRIRTTFRRHREPDAARALTKLLRKTGAGKRSGGGGFSRSRGTRIVTRQKCVAKAHYSNSLGAHRVQLEYYLTREGTERDGSRAKLYGTDLEEYRRHMVDKNFRVFLSPQSDKINLTRLANAFIKRLELQTGYTLYWQAANHYNTAHPHAHLLINGVDQNGREVSFSRDMIKTFMREASRDLCTAQLGTRSREELRLEKEKELTAPRYTKLDGRIKELTEGNRVRLDGLTLNRERILARLEYLRTLKLCVYKDGAYRLSPRWEEDLKANGRYNAFLTSRKGLLYTDAARLRVYAGSEGVISGKVTKIFRTDGDASDNHAAIIECPDGKAWFVPLFRKPEIRDKDAKSPLQEGEYVTLKTYENQKGRLTPVIYRKDIRALRQEIKKQRYGGKLAEAILSENPFKKETIRRAADAGT
jgi:hypothetical protein